MNGQWPHNALQHHWLTPISCHFQDCKVLLVTSLTHVSGAITSVQTFTFTFNTDISLPTEVIYDSLKAISKSIHMKAVKLTGACAE